MIKVGNISSKMNKACHPYYLLKVKITTNIAWKEIEKQNKG